MKLGRIVAGVGVLVLLLVAGYFAMGESGEVVVLETRDASGAHHTRVWVVDRDGAAWLRTGNPESPWLARLRANPEVAVKRGGESREYLAVPVEDEATREQINALELEKYGLAEKLLRLMIDPAHATPIRLDPR
jgi:F420H(2)-dependent quinone reductase